ncbi:MAG: hypothetical protein ACLGSD_13955 [Acidobacteriota bacterium]
MLRETVATMMLRIRHRAESEYPIESIARQQEKPGYNGPGAAMDGRLQTPGERDTVERRTRILLISDYEGLRTSREVLLRKQGYDVRAITSAEFLEKPDSCQGDLAILCQSLESGRARAVGEILRRKCHGLSLLRIYPCRTSLEPVFDLGVDGFDGPEVLLDVLQQFVFTHPARP